MRQIYREDVFGPMLGRVSMSRTQGQRSRSIVHEAKRLWATRLWVEMSSMGRNVYGANCLWGEKSINLRNYQVECDLLFIENIYLYIIIYGVVST